MNATELARFKSKAEQERSSAEKYATRYQHRSSVHDEIAERHEQLYEDAQRRWYSMPRERYLKTQAPLIRLGYAVARAITWPIRSTDR